MLGAKVLDIFSMAGRYNKPVQYGRESPIKAGQREAMPHLTTTCTKSNITISEK